MPWSAAGTFAALLVSATLVGCLRSPSVSGGTSGTIRSGGAAVPDLQINVFRREGDEFLPVGSGVSDATGCFELAQIEAAGPLRLEPGEYAFTIESVGPVPLRIAPECRDPEQTPLKQTCTEPDPTLSLDLSQTHLRWSNTP